MSLIASLRFLHATIIHKRYVYQAGHLIGVSRWQLAIHDLDKFLPRIFVPYGRFFYALPGAGWLKAVLDKSSEARAAMTVAWLRHVQRNAHHW